MWNKNLCEKPVGTNKLANIVLFIMLLLKATRLIYSYFPWTIQSIKALALGIQITADIRGFCMKPKQYRMGFLMKKLNNTSPLLLWNAEAYSGQGSRVKGETTKPEHGRHTSTFKLSNIVIVTINSAKNMCKEFVWQLWRWSISKYNLGFTVSVNRVLKTVWRATHDSWRRSRHTSRNIECWSSTHCTAAGSTIIDLTWIYKSTLKLLTCI